MMRIVILILLFGLFIGCAPDFSHCVTCEKEVGGYYITLGIGPPTWVSEYKQTLACSEEAVAGKRSDGWRCPDYNNSNDNNGAPKAGQRIVYLTAPLNKTVYVPLDSLLIWSDIINWYENDYAIINGVTYDVYFGTETTPTTVVSEGQKDVNYAPILGKSTTYYWKVVAESPNGDKSESKVWSFTTSPEINLGTFTDSRDGHVYKTVSIGSQIWLAENLGYEIPDKQITDTELWYKNFFDNSISSYGPTRIFDAWSYYDNDVSFKDTYGVLYQWEAAKAACPPGWHLPSVAEWEAAIDYLGGQTSAGGYLKEVGITHWAHPNAGPNLGIPNVVANNYTGFTALPGGSKDIFGSFNKSIGQVGLWWTSTEVNPDNAWGLTMSAGYGSTNLDSHNKNSGFSVRCIKDD